MNLMSKSDRDLLLNNWSDSGKRQELLYEVSGDDTLAGIAYFSLFTMNMHDSKGLDETFFCTTITNNLGYYYQVAWGEYRNILKSISITSKIELFWSECDHYDNCKYFVSSPKGKLNSYEDKHAFPSQVKDEFERLFSY